GSLGKIARQTSMPPQSTGMEMRAQLPLVPDATGRTRRSADAVVREPVRHARAAPVRANREQQASAPPNLKRSVKVATAKSFSGPDDIIPEPDGESGGPKIAAEKPGDNAGASVRDQDDAAPDTVIAQGVTEPRGELFVMLTAGRPELTMTVRQASKGTPGFAQAAALHENDNGDLLWAQSTISSDRPGPELVLLALSSPRPSP